MWVSISQINQVFLKKKPTLSADNVGFFSEKPTLLRETQITDQIMRV